jgi:DtxR family Mn-dependent transcriptional regulator
LFEWGIEMKRTAVDQQNEKLTASNEDYLKTVYLFSQKDKNVRSADIAVFLGVTKPSVHRTMKVLQEAGFVIKPLYGEISLTDKGRLRAEIILCKHCLLKKLLLSLQVNENTAEQDACRMEHIVSEETLLHLLQLFKTDQLQAAIPTWSECWAENAKYGCELMGNSERRVC